MPTVPIVREIMVETSFGVPPDTEAFKALDILVRKKLSGVPVIDDDRRVIGFLTEKDCLRLLAVAHQYNMTGRTVRDIMSAIKQSLRPDMDLLTAAMRFLSCNFATLPVVEDEYVVGSISRLNMLCAIQKMHQNTGRTIESTKKTIRLVDNPSSIEELQFIVSKSSRQQLASVFGGRHSIAND